MRRVVFVLLFACTGGGNADDADSDGFSAEVDCDDDDATVHPEALETCDGRDEDCDGDVDEDAIGGTWTLVEGDEVGTGGTEILAVAAGDVDGDGALDLLAMDAAEAKVIVLAGAGDGTLSPVGAFPAGTEPAGLAVGDVDGDQLSDAVVADYPTKTLVTLLANGAGGLGAGSASPALELSPNGVALARFDAGSTLDIAYSAAGAGGVMLGAGDGSFTSWVSEPLELALGVATADFDGDEHLDLALGGYGGVVEVVLLDADGVVTTHTAVAPLDVTGVATADLDGDDDPDLVAISDLGDIEAYLGQGDGTLVSSWTGTASLELFSLQLGDLDGDDVVDLVVAGTRIDVFRGHGDGTFGNAVPITDDVGIGGVVLGDFTGDGRDDIAYVTLAGDAAIFTATLTCQ